MISCHDRRLLAFRAGLWLLAACSGAREGLPAPLQGVVEYDDRVIGFELGGRVLEVGAERGQAIQNGALLARLDDGLERPLRELRVAELAAAQAQVRLLRAGARGEDLRASQAEIDALHAQEDTLTRSVARQTQLHAAGAAAEASIDNLTGELRTTSERRHALEQRLKALRSGARVDEIGAAEAHTQAAAASLAIVDARLARYVLHSPSTGTVVDVHVKSGEMVAPGAPAVTVADLDHPFVDVFVPEGRLKGMHVGAATEVRVDGVPAALQGRIEHVFPHTEFTPRFLFSEDERPNLVLRVRVRVQDTAQRLHAGVPAFVRLAGGGGG
jgi:HlyD family secretion protein